jgi:hypothetical protein
MQRVRSNLYRFKENVELLELKDSLIGMIREHGKPHKKSRVSPLSIVYIVASLVRFVDDGFPMVKPY